MKTIHKRQLFQNTVTYITLPKDTKFLCVQEQFGMPQVWYLLDPALPLECNWELYVHNTGEYFDNEFAEYLGTVQLMGGHSVCHVFAREVK